MYLSEAAGVFSPRNDTGLFQGAPLAEYGYGSGGREKGEHGKEGWGVLSIFCPSLPPPSSLGQFAQLGARDNKLLVR